MKYLSKSPEPGNRRSILSLISHSNSQKIWDKIEKLKEKKEQIRKNLSKLIIQLDQLTNARSTITFVLIFYLLGNSLHYFILGIIILEIYLIIYRLIRYWINDSLMLMLSYVYFGNILLCYFLIFSPKNLNLFITVFSSASGVISLTVIVDNNNVELGNSDFITSTFFDCIPILTSWAVRWKHLLYYEKDSYYVLSIGDIDISNKNILKQLIFLPITSWLVWAFGYLLLNGKILRKFAYSDLYESQIYKFYHSKTLGNILGDHKKYTILKFLSIQLAFLIISIPVQLSCFYNFYFHSGYLVFMIILLGYNSARIKEEKIKGIIKNV